MKTMTPLSVLLSLLAYISKDPKLAKSTSFLRVANLFPNLVSCSKTMSAFSLKIAAIFWLNLFLFLFNERSAILRLLQFWDRILNLFVNMFCAPPPPLWSGLEKKVSSKMTDILNIYLPMCFKGTEMGKRNTKRYTPTSPILLVVSMKVWVLHGITN